MTVHDQDIDFVIEVFVRGHSTVRSRTFPYEAKRVGRMWVMRDAPRSTPPLYRNEEWIAYGVEPAKAHAIAHQRARAFFHMRRHHRG